MTHGEKKQFEGSFAYNASAKTNFFSIFKTHTTKNLNKLTQNLNALLRTMFSCRLRLNFYNLTLILLQQIQLLFVWVLVFFVAIYFNCNQSSHCACQNMWYALRWNHFPTAWYWERNWNAKQNNEHTNRTVLINRRKQYDTLINTNYVIRMKKKNVLYSQLRLLLR